MSTTDTTNPFQHPPTPMPYDPSDLEVSGRAWDVFAPEVIARVFEDNMDWLQFSPRTTRQVREALFPWFTRAGMTDQEILTRISFALWEAGYQYSNQGPNPTWTWEEAS